MKALLKQRWMGDALAFCIGLALVWLTLYYLVGPQKLRWRYDGQIPTDATNPYHFDWRTLFRCLSLGLLWLCLRDIAFRVAARVGWRSLSALLTLAAALGAWYGGRAVASAFDLWGSRLVVQYTFLAVCFGWGLASELMFGFPPARDLHKAAARPSSA